MKKIISKLLAVCLISSIVNSNNIVIAQQLINTEPVEIKQHEENYEEENIETVEPEEKEDTYISKEETNDNQTALFNEQLMNSEQTIDIYNSIKEIVDRKFADSYFPLATVNNNLLRLNLRKYIGRCFYELNYYRYPGDFGEVALSMSIATIKVDGENYLFDPDEITSTDNSIIATMYIEDLEIQQHLTLVHNSFSGRENCLKIEYIVNNSSSRSYDVGIRMLLDPSLCGDYDGYSSTIKIPELGESNKEWDIVGSYVPDSWQLIEDIENNAFVVDGTLKVGDSPKPDRIRFTDFDEAIEHNWDYYREKGLQNYDTAVCLYWNPRSIVSGEDFKCTTLYGVNYLKHQVIETPSLELDVIGQDKLEVKENSQGQKVYNPNPFTVKVNIENIGTMSANNVNATLNLPGGMKILNGEKIVKVGNLPNGQSREASWKVWVEPSEKDRVEDYSVSVVSDNIEAKEVNKKITIPKLINSVASADVELLLDRKSMQDNQSLKFKIRNVSDETLDLNTISTRYYFTDETPSKTKVVDIDYAQVNNRGIGSGEIITKVVDNLESNLDSANAYVEFDFSKIADKLLPNQEITVNARLHEKNYQAMNLLNDYSYNDEIKVEYGFNSWSYMPVYSNQNYSKPIYGKNPEISNVMTVLGTYYKDGKIVEWAHPVEENADNFHRDKSFEASLTDMKLEEKDGKVTLSGKINTTDYIKEVIFTGYKLVSTDEYSNNIFGDRVYFVLDSTENFEVLSCHIEKNASSRWIQVENRKNLIGKDVFRINLLDKNTGGILELESEWKNSDIELTNIPTAREDQSDLVRYYNTWFTEYVAGVYDTGWADRVQVSSGSKNNEEALDMNGYALVPSELFDDGYTRKEYIMTSQGRKIYLSKDMFSGEHTERYLPYLFNADILVKPVQKEIQIVDYKKGQKLFIDQDTKSAPEDGGYCYYITNYPSRKEKFIEILEWKYYNGYRGIQVSSNSFRMGMEVRRNYTYFYEQASGELNRPVDKIYASGPSNLYLTNIKFMQNISSPPEQKYCEPYIKNIRPSYRGVVVEEKSWGEKIKSTWNLVSGNVPILKDGVGFCKDITEWYKEISTSYERPTQQVMTTHPQYGNLQNIGNYAYSFSSPLDYLGDYVGAGIKFYDLNKRNNNRYRIKVHNGIFLDLGEDMRLTKSKDNFMMEMSLGLLQTHKNKLFMLDKNYFDKSKDKVGILNEVYYDTNQVFSYNYEFGSYIQFDIMRKKDRHSKEKIKRWAHEF